MNKKFILPAALVVGLGLLAYTSTKVAAQGGSGHPPIIARLAEKFGKSEDEVKAVFDEERQARQTAMQARFQEKLGEAVTAGELSEEQKQLILAKHEEIRNQRATDQEQWQNLTPEERRAKAQERQQVMQQWAEANGIDLKYFNFRSGEDQGMHRGAGMKGEGMGMGRGMAQ